MADCNLLRDLQTQLHNCINASTDSTRVFTYRGVWMSFLLGGLHILESPSARLNDVCLNGIATLFHLIFADPACPTAHHVNRCALFTTFDLLMIRYNAFDADMWRRVKHTKFWSKDFWIHPIH